MATRVLTQYYPGLLDSDQALALFIYLAENIEWEDGIPSKSGPTRKAKAMEPGMDVYLDTTIVNVLNSLGLINKGIYGIYLNYYRDGEDFTPSHSHKGTQQVVISLGSSRILTMGQKQFTLNNGDVITFGSSAHGVPKDPNCFTGRISIAFFIEL